MSTTTISSRKLTQDTSGAKKASRKGPVIVTDRGKPAHVLLSREAYETLTVSGTRIVEILAMPKLADFDLHTQRASWAQSASPARLFLCAVSLLELETGILRFERRDRIGSWPDCGRPQYR